MRRDILGLALAGGKSRRLGEDKVALSFHEGVSQLDYTLGILSAFCSRVGVSGKESQRSSRQTERAVEYIVDAGEIEGPMSGVVAGLRSAASWPVLVLACDMPLVDAALVLRLISQRDSAQWATCYLGSDGKAEPLCALYEPVALIELEARAAEGAFSLRDFLENGRVARVHCERPQLLASVNTREDLASIKENGIRFSE